MSASLVGSEMCIRDSCWGGCPLGWQARPGAFGRCLRSMGASPEGPRSKSVSYTHLTLPTICSV
eukprot:7213752-Alexandrium_andersonii.AAC.1